MAYRVVAKFDEKTIRRTLKTGSNQIGSDPACEVCLRNPTVSRRHAVLTVRADGGIELEDLGSTNGTLMRSRRIDGTEVVLPGDTFVIGRVVVLLEEVAEDDLEVGIVLPRIGADPSGSLRFDLELDEAEKTDIFGPLDDFTLKQLPRLLEALHNGSDRHLLAQRVGAAVYESMPVIAMEIYESGAVEKGLLYSAERTENEQQHLLPTSLPHWVEARKSVFQLRACFQTQRAGQHLESVIESVAWLLAAADTRQGEPPPATAPSSRPERPQPRSVDGRVRQIYDQAERVAQGDVGVMIYGESGTGKEVLANFLHAASPRADQPMVAINCASLPRDLLEAELFGVERGVATGVEARAGKFEAADGGTLFLDEIGDMAPETQAKILRVLQEQQVYRIGGHTPRQATARIVAATNRPIQKLIAEGTFRNDLYHRIATWEVELPPLRHRPADIPNLAVHFLAQEASRHKIRAKGISRRALRALTNYSWPGNIRQLRNEIARAVLFLDRGDLLDSERLSPEILGEGTDRNASLTDVLERVERTEIKMALKSCGGDTAAAAERLKISRPTLYRRIKSLGIDTGDSSKS